MEIEAKKNICILTKIAMAFALTLIVFVVAGILSDIYRFSFSDAVKTALVVLMFVLLMSLPFLTIASLIRISLHGGRLRGRLMALLLLALSSFVIYTIAYYEVPRAKNWSDVRVICGTHLKGLGTAFMVYAHDYDGMLPADNWGDRLIEEADVSPRSIKCPRSDAVEGESDYCLNIHAAGKRLDDLPADMVLLFEAVFEPAEGQRREPIRQRPGFAEQAVMREMFSGDEKVYPDRWNQVGGPERLAYDRHDDGCIFLFADGESRHVARAELPGLRWNVENTIFFEVPPGDAVPPKPYAMPLSDVLLRVLGGVSLVVAAGILIQCKALRCWKFALFLCVLSAATGWLFGRASEEAYISFGNTGEFAGLFFGALAGVCFAPLLAGCPERIKRLHSFLWFAIPVGMATGIVCSTLVHLALMIVNRTANPFGIIIGIPYGTFAGAVLGLIAGLIVRKYYAAGPGDDA